MTDHEHEWRIRQSRAPAGGVVIFCLGRGCILELIVEDAEAILNEHAALKRVNEQVAQITQEPMGDAEESVQHRESASRYYRIRDLLFPDALADTEESR